MFRFSRFAFCSSAIASTSTSSSSASSSSSSSSSVASFLKTAIAAAVSVTSSSTAAASTSATAASPFPLTLPSPVIGQDSTHDVVLALQQLFSAAAAKVSAGPLSSSLSSSISEPKLAQAGNDKQQQQQQQQVTAALPLPPALQLPTAVLSFECLKGLVLFALGSNTAQISNADIVDLCCSVMTALHNFYTNIATVALAPEGKATTTAAGGGGGGGGGGAEEEEAKRQSQRHRMALRQQATQAKNWLQQLVPAVSRRLDSADWAALVSVARLLSAARHDALFRPIAMQASRRLAKLCEPRALPRADASATRSATDGRGSGAAATTEAAEADEAVSEEMKASSVAPAAAAAMTDAAAAAAAATSTPPLELVALSLPVMTLKGQASRTTTTTTTTTGESNKTLGNTFATSEDRANYKNNINSGSSSASFVNDATIFDAVATLRLLCSWCESLEQICHDHVFISAAAGSTAEATSDSETSQQQQQHQQELFDRLRDSPQLNIVLNNAAHEKAVLCFIRDDVRRFVKDNRTDQNSAAMLEVAARVDTLRKFTMSFLMRRRVILSHYSNDKQLQEQQQSNSSSSSSSSSLSSSSLKERAEDFLLFAHSRDVGASTSNASTGQSQFAAMFHTALLRVADALASEVDQKTMAAAAAATTTSEGRTTSSSAAIINMFLPDKLLQSLVAATTRHWARSHLEMRRLFLACWHAMLAGERQMAQELLAISSASSPHVDGTSDYDLFSHLNLCRFAITGLLRTVEMDLAALAKSRQNEQEQQDAASFSADTEATTTTATFLWPQHRDEVTQTVETLAHHLNLLGARRNSMIAERLKQKQQLQPSQKIAEAAKKSSDSAAAPATSVTRAASLSVAADDLQRIPNFGTFLYVEMQLAKVLFAITEDKESAARVLFADLGDKNNQTDVATSASEQQHQQRPPLRLLGKSILFSLPSVFTYPSDILDFVIIIVRALPLVASNEAAAKNDGVSGDGAAATTAAAETPALPLWYLHLFDLSTASIATAIQKMTTQQQSPGGDGNTGHDINKANAIRCVGELLSLLGSLNDGKNPNYSVLLPLIMPHLAKFIAAAVTKSTSTPEQQLAAARLLHDSNTATTCDVLARLVLLQLARRGKELAVDERLELLRLVAAISTPALHSLTGASLLLLSKDVPGLFATTSWTEYLEQQQQQQQQLNEKKSSSAAAPSSSEQNADVEGRRKKEGDDDDENENDDAEDKDVSNDATTEGQGGESFSANSINNNKNNNNDNNNASDSAAAYLLDIYQLARTCNAPSVVDKLVEAELMRTPPPSPSLFRNGSDNDNNITMTEDDVEEEREEHLRCCVRWALRSLLLCEAVFAPSRPTSSLAAFQKAAKELLLMSPTDGGVAAPPGATAVVGELQQALCAWLSLAKDLTNSSINNKRNDNDKNSSSSSSSKKSHTASAASAFVEQNLTKFVLYVGTHLEQTMLHERQKAEAATALDAKKSSSSNNNSGAAKLKEEEAKGLREEADNDDEGGNDEDGDVAATNNSGGSPAVVCDEDTGASASVRVEEEGTSDDAATAAAAERANNEEEDDDIASPPTNSNNNNNDSNNDAQKSLQQQRYQLTRLFLQLSGFALRRVDVSNVGAGADIAAAVKLLRLVTACSGGSDFGFKDVTTQQADTTTTTTTITLNAAGDNDLVAACTHVFRQLPEQEQASFLLHCCTVTADVSAVSSNEVTTVGAAGASSSSCYTTSSLLVERLALELGPEAAEKIPLPAAVHLLCFEQKPATGAATGRSESQSSEMRSKILARLKRSSSSSSSPSPSEIAPPITAILPFMSKLDRETVSAVLDAHFRSVADGTCKPLTLAQGLSLLRAAAAASTTTTAATSADGGNKSTTQQQLLSPAHLRQVRDHLVSLPPALRCGGLAGRRNDDATASDAAELGATLIRIQGMPGDILSPETKQLLSCRAIGFDGSISSGAQLVAFISEQRTSSEEGGGGSSNPLTAIAPVMNFIHEQATRVCLVERVAVSSGEPASSPSSCSSSSSSNSNDGVTLYRPLIVALARADLLTQEFVDRTCVEQLFAVLSPLSSASYAARESAASDILFLFRIAAERRLLDRSHIERLVTVVVESTSANKATCSNQGSETTTSRTTTTEGEIANGDNIDNKKSKNESIFDPLELVDFIEQQFSSSGTNNNSAAQRNNIAKQSLLTPLCDATQRLLVQQLGATLSDAASIDSSASSLFGSSNNNNNNRKQHQQQQQPHQHILLRTVTTIQKCNTSLLPELRVRVREHCAKIVHAVEPAALAGMLRVIIGDPLLSVQALDVITDRLERVCPLLSPDDWLAITVALASAQGWCDASKVEMSIELLCLQYLRFNENAAASSSSSSASSSNRRVASATHVAVLELLARFGVQDDEVIQVAANGVRAHIKDLDYSKQLSLLESMSRLFVDAAHDDIIYAILHSIEYGKAVPVWAVVRALRCSCDLGVPFNKTLHSLFSRAYDMRQVIAQVPELRDWMRHAVTEYDKSVVQQVAVTFSSRKRFAAE